MSKLQDAIQVLEDKLQQGVDLEISLEFSTDGAGDPVVDYRVLFYAGEVLSNIDMPSVEDALIDIAGKLEVQP